MWLVHGHALNDWGKLEIGKESHIWHFRMVRLVLSMLDCCSCAQQVSPTLNINNLYANNLK